MPVIGCIGTYNNCDTGWSDEKLDETIKNREKNPTVLYGTNEIKYEGHIQRHPLTSIKSLGMRKSLIIIVIGAFLMASTELT